MQKRRLPAVVLGLMLGMLLAALDQTIMSTALPTIVGELGGIDRMTWLQTAYLLASTAVVPIVGKLCDLYGRRLWYLTGMAIFIAGSALCGTAQNMTQLILFRGLQGLGGGMLMPVAQTIIGDLFPGEQRARIQGVFVGVFGLASIVGPKVGGWLVDYWHWRWAFWINLPLGVLAALVVALTLKETRGAGARTIDYWGAITVAAGVSLLMLGLSEGGRRQVWTAPDILATLAAATVLLGLFLWLETRVPDPILDLGLFRNRVFAVANVIIFLTGMGMFGALIFVPLFMQGVVGVSASAAGSVMTPMMLGVVVAGVIGGRLLFRIGYRTQLAAGMGLMSVGFYLMSTLSSSATQATATVFMATTGLGLGLVMPTVTIAVQNAFPASQRGVVTSATAFFRSVGATVGVAALGSVMNSRASAEITGRLAAALAQVPPAAAPALKPLQDLMAGSPQALFGLLLRPDALEKVPAPLQQPLLRLLKESLVASLHTVFLAGLGLLLAGIVAAFFLGKARFDGQPAGHVASSSAD